MFKHTADVVEDYICYFLTAIGAIALSVRFLSSLGTGDLSCIIAGERKNVLSSCCHHNCKDICDVCLCCIIPFLSTIKSTERVMFKELILS